MLSFWCWEIFLLFKPSLQLINLNKIKLLFQKRYFYLFTKRILKYKNGFNLSSKTFRRTIVVISRNPSFKVGRVQFTMVLLKPYVDIFLCLFFDDINYIFNNFVIIFLHWKCLLCWPSYFSRETTIENNQILNVKIYFILNQNLINI